MTQELQKLRKTRSGAGGNGLQPGNTAEPETTDEIPGQKLGG